ncbi:MAG: RHS repeat-associated core domain-containing protein [Phycisphaerae bacterium]|nr:RHS repeat-associated core domain-containing protein [Phycisphaerae bacterium]MDD5381974.1 RHS repeat-associated core domain-containing protein [Phycisphaerae bacterium]
MAYLLEFVIETKTLNSVDTDYEYDKTAGDSDIYDCDIMTKAGNDALTWDENGRLTAKPSFSFVYNWEGKLRSATAGSDSISLKYDPFGNRVWRQSTVSGQTTTRRKYVVDISGELPTILLELDPNDSMAIKKTYIYADSQILAQHNGSHNAARFFYLHDRLGSARLVINNQGATQNSYTYNPFGESFATECTENTENSFKYTGQYYDSEINQYYLRARQYDPALMRFTGRDPESGKFEEPLTLHKYLYCLNNPINHTDPSGREISYAETLVVNGILGSLRKLDCAFSTTLFRESAKASEIFNIMGMNQAIQAELLMAQFEGGLTRAGIRGIVGIVNFVGSNLTDTVLQDKLIKFGDYLAGDIASGNLDWLLDDPSMKNFENYLSSWGERFLRD